LIQLIISFRLIEKLSSTIVNTVKDECRLLLPTGGKLHRLARSMEGT
jgi:hypothetical protein